MQYPRGTRSCFEIHNCTVPQGYAVAFRPCSTQATQRYAGALRPPAVPPGYARCLSRGDTLQSPRGHAVPYEPHASTQRYETACFETPPVPQGYAVCHFDTLAVPSRLMQDNPGYAVHLRPLQYPGYAVGALETPHQYKQTQGVPPAVSQTGEMRKAGLQPECIERCQAAAAQRYPERRILIYPSLGTASSERPTPPPC
ncbi:unnamed protein product [Boreogadus saida]